jgi:hypothetical protein
MGTCFVWLEAGAGDAWRVIFVVVEVFVGGGGGLRMCSASLDFVNSSLTWSP